MSLQYAGLKNSGKGQSSEMRLFCFRLAASMDTAALLWEYSGMYVTEVTVTGKQQQEELNRVFWPGNIDLEVYIKNTERYYTSMTH